MVFMLYMAIWELKERLKKDVLIFEILYPHPWKQGLYRVFHAVPVVLDSENIIYMVLKYDRDKDKTAAEQISNIEKVGMYGLDLLMDYIQDYIKHREKHEYEMRITSAGVTDRVQFKDPMEPFYVFADHLKKFNPAKGCPNFFITIKRKENGEWIDEKIRCIFIDAPKSMYMSVKYTDDHSVLEYSSKFYRNIPEMLNRINSYLREKINKEETKKIFIFCEESITPKGALFHIYP